MSRPSGAGRRLGRAAELAADASVTASTVAAHLVEDPLLLALQTTRRLPRRVVAPATRVLLRVGDRRGAHRAGLATALGAWLAGTPDVAGDVLEALAARRPARRWRRARGRLAAELAVQLGRPELVDRLLDGRAPALQARAAWLRGDLTAAVARAGGPGGSRVLGDRLASEARVLQAGWWPVPPTRPAHGGAGGPRAGRRPHGTGRPGPAAFHVLTNSLPHTHSGYTARSHAVLTAQRDAGIRVEAATRLTYPVSIGVLLARHRDTVDGVDYRRLVPFRTARTAEARAGQHAELLLPLVERFAPDVLHATTNFANALATRAVAQALGVPWVYEVRGLLEETWVAGRPAGPEREHAARSERHALLRARETEVARAADAVVTLSATLRDELVDRGVPADRITVVPNAVDAALLDLSASPPDARRAVGLPGEGFWVGTVSSLVDYEGLDTLIDAVGELRRRGVDARALVVGDGVSRPGLERRAAAAGLGSAAVFTGRVPRSQAPAYHQALDVFVVPRRDVRVCRTVTPLKPTEAMAVGRPVVASDLPALAELVEPHGSGRLVRPDDATALADCLHALHDSPGERERHARAGRSFAASRTWDTAGSRYRSLYEQLGASSGAA